jgi:hypothetical protein
VYVGGADLGYREKVNREDGAWRYILMHHKCFDEWKKNG